MNADLQKASLLKRFSAWLLDAILVCVLATGCFWGISVMIDFETHSAKLEAYYTQYETKYQISFDYVTIGYEALTEAEKKAFDAMTEEEKTAFDENYRKTCEEAYQDMVSNEEMVFTYNLLLQMTLLMIGIGIFLAVLIIEFVIPLFLRNGQTVGKKVFGLAVMRTNCVRINAVSLFIRTVLGKYAIETMIPVFIVTMWLLSIMGIGGTVVLVILVLIEAGMMILTTTNSMIHDKLSDTVVVDMGSQMIFDSQEALLEHQKRLANEKADRQTY